MGNHKVARLQNPSHLDFVASSYKIFFHRLTSYIRTVRQTVVMKKPGYTVKAIYVGSTITTRILSKSLVIHITPLTQQILAHVNPLRAFQTRYSVLIVSWSLISLDILCL